MIGSIINVMQNISRNNRLLNLLFQRNRMIYNLKTSRTEITQVVDFIKRVLNNRT